MFCIQGLVFFAKLFMWKKPKLGVVIHAYNPGTGEAKEEGW
jgi:hypothetical protein